VIDFDIPPIYIIYRIPLGPLELTRRQKVLVWDDEIEIPVDAEPADPSLSPAMSPPALLDERRRSLSERRVRSHSFGSFPFPPPLLRSTTDSPAGTRPVPFAGKFQKINPGASGVRVLEHMERFDEVERGLKKLGMEETVLEEDEEEDVGVRPVDTQVQPEAGPPVDRSLPEMHVESENLLDGDVGDGDDEPSEQHLEALAASTLSAPMLSGYSSDEETEAGDALTSSLHDIRQQPRSSIGHNRTTSDDGGRRSFDWARMRRKRRPEPAEKTRTVIVEVCIFILIIKHGTDPSLFNQRLETVDAKPFFAC